MRQMSKVLPAGLGRSPGVGHDSPLQYSCLENPMGEAPGGLLSMGKTGNTFVLIIAILEKASIS